MVRYESTKKKKISISVKYINLKIKVSLHELNAVKITFWELITITRYRESYLCMTSKSNGC